MPHGATSYTDNYGGLQYQWLKRGYITNKRPLIRAVILRLSLLNHIYSIRYSRETSCWTYTVAGCEIILAHRYPWFASLARTATQTSYRMADIQNCLRSSTSDILEMHPTQLANVSDSAFPAATSKLWNKLPGDVTPFSQRMIFAVIWYILVLLFDSIVFIISACCQHHCSTITLTWPLTYGAWAIVWVTTPVQQFAIKKVWQDLTSWTHYCY